MGGRKLTPTELQIARGDPRKYGKRKLEQKLAAEPKAERGLPDCPKHLIGRAREAWNFWREDLENMNIDARPDAMMLEGACISYARAVQAEIEINRLGAVVEDPIVDARTGEIIGHKLKKNPWVDVQSKALTLEARFCGEFGLSPVSRSRLTIEKKDEGEMDLMKILSQPRPEKKKPAALPTESVQ